MSIPNVNQERTLKMMQAIDFVAPGSSNDCIMALVFCIVDRAAQSGMSEQEINERIAIAFRTREMAKSGGVQ